MVFTQKTRRSFFFHFFPFCSTIEEVSFDDEDGDLRDKEDIAFRQEAMEEKNHVTWNAERRCFLNAEAAER